jgi:hypothetical protein
MKIYDNQRISDLNGCDYIISQIRLKLIALDRTQPILSYITKLLIHP